MDEQGPAETLATGGPTDAALVELRTMVAEHAKQDGVGDWTLILGALDELIALRALVREAAGARGSEKLEPVIDQLVAVVSGQPPPA